MKWLKDGSVLNCSGVKYDSRYKDGQCDLTISDVSQEDSGRYSCIAADGQVAISTADVLVEGMFKSVAVINLCLVLICTTSRFNETRETRENH